MSNDSKGTAPTPESAVVIWEGGGRERPERTELPEGVVPFRKPEQQTGEAVVSVRPLQTADGARLGGILIVSSGFGQKVQLPAGGIRCMAA